MQEIRCPNCGEVFQVDESDYAQIVQQVRDKEFEKELSRRTQEMENSREVELRLVRMEQEQVHNRIVSGKDATIADKDREIAALKAKLDSTATAQKLAVAEAISDTEHKLSEKITEIVELRGKLESNESESRLREKSLKEQYEDKLKLKDEQIEYYEIKLHDAINITIKNDANSFQNIQSNFFISTQLCHCIWCKGSCLS